jgi:hypothetical protein
MGMRDTGRGVGYTKHLDETLQGGIYQLVPDIAFLYETSTTQDPNFAVGDIVITPDGREYVYSKSAGACISGQGAEFTYAGYTAYTAFAVTASVGDREVTVPAATHAALSVDELRGGYIWIFDGSTNNTQFRGIVGNDSADADALFKVYLDGPLTEAVTTSSACETTQNPYASLQTGTMNYNPKAGVPAVKVTAANTYFWCQKKGFCWVAPQGGKLGTTEGGYVGGLWSDVGNISDYNTSLGVTVAGGRGSQHAGFSVLGDADNIGPLFMLQG